MGLMQGKVVGNSLVIVDSFALPVQGTETRVNAAEAANEYMVQYIEGSSRVSVSVKYTLPSSCIDPVQGVSIGECCWLVSFASWIWMLALWY